MKNKILLITGGTGSFGNAVLKRLLNTDIKEIRIFSRDEKKQNEMRKTFRNKKIKFFIGDVRDANSIDDVMKGVDYVFHAAALKQVPSCEFFPMQAFNTNVIGSENVLNSAIKASVERVVVLSTDKAVYPINAMGISKAMMEKVVIAKGLNENHTKILCTRYGNVMASRGSVIPLFLEQLKKNEPITITNPKMTRFMMSLEQAVELVMYAFNNGKSGDIFVHKSPATNVKNLANSLAYLMKKKDYNIKIIGTRHGEKLYETLLTKEEMAKAKDLGKYFCIPADNRDLNYDKYFEEGTETISNTVEYHSQNTSQLNQKELQNLLLTIPEIKLQIERL